MQLITTYQGGDDPFEGDRTFWLRSLPAGAIVSQASLTLSPQTSPASGKGLFQEVFSFNSTLGDGELKAQDWSVTKLPDPAGTFVEIDFHTRRTLAAVQGTGGPLTLQVDMGGAYVGIASDGSLLTPDKTPFPVNFTVTSAPVLLPSLTVSKLRLSPSASASAPPPASVTRLIVRSAPSNLIVRLGQLPAFWTRPGELTLPETSPDFATLLNAFLLNASPQDGFYAIPFVIHSDTLARFNLTVTIDYQIVQPVLPPHLSELNLTYGFSTLPSISDTLTTIEIPQNAGLVPTAATAKIIGEFQSTRIALGLVGDLPLKTNAVEVSPRCSVAQLLESDQEIEVLGFDLPLGNTQPGLAGLNLSLQTDADGKPSGEVLLTMNVTVEKPLPEQSTWGSAALLTPFRILPRHQQRYWLILQSEVGQAFWLAVPEQFPEKSLQCSRDGGLSWRAGSAATATTPLATLFRLRNQPDRFTVPVQLQVGRGETAVRQLLHEFDPLGRVEFSFDFTQTLKDYLSHATPARCKPGELLVNGSFDQPLPNDASRRLFGFDAANSASDRYQGIVGRVDLSRGINLSQARSISLSLKDDDPNTPPITVQVDCAGANPSRTQGEEIEAQMNLAIQKDVAEYYGGHLILRPPDEATTIQLNPWFEIAIPQGWQQPSQSKGSLWRIKFPIVCADDLTNRDNPESSRISSSQQTNAMLQSIDAGPTLLSQTVVVTGDCAYVLQFRFFALSEDRSQPDPARWQVAWFDANQQFLRQDEGILPTAPQSDLNDSFFDFFFSAGQANAPIPCIDIDLSPISIRFNAPTAAVQAELRFVQPLRGALLLDDVSFASTSEQLGNPNLILADDLTAATATPSDYQWVAESGWVDPLAQGVVLNGTGPEDAILTQTVPISGGADSTGRYRLLINAFPLAARIPKAEQQPIAQRARVELHWFKDQQSLAHVIIPLDGQDFPDYAWQGALAPGATHAELRLIQPRNQGKLQVNSISFAPIAKTNVPLIFLAETPGQLTISDLRVAYR